MSCLNEEESKQPIVYSVPPSVDGKTWAEVEKAKIDAQNKQIDKISQIINNITASFKDYYMKKTARATYPAYIMIGMIAIIAGILAWTGKISGETFAFLGGSIVGYLISILSKHL